MSDISRNDVSLKNKTLLSISHLTNEIVFCYDPLDFLRSRSYERSCVQIMQLVKFQKPRKIGEYLVADAVAYLVVLLHFVDDVVTDFAVFPYTQYKIADATCAVSDQKYTALFFSHEEVGGFLPANWTEIPAENKGLFR